MRRFAWKWWNLPILQRGTRSKQHSYRPAIEFLENRLTPADLDPASLSGLIYFDANNNNTQDASERGLPGTTVTLSNAASVSVSTETDANGAFSFSHLHAGTYTLTRGSSIFRDGQIAAGNLGGTPASRSITSITLAEGQDGTGYLFGMQALPPEAISLRLFLASAPDLLPAAGEGTDSPAPFVQTPISDMFLNIQEEEIVDLAGIFADPDTSNSLVRFNTTQGPLNVELFDAQAPKTVANFFNYIDEGKYTDALFHRRANSPNILQGGGFTFTTNAATSATSLVDVPTDGFTSTSGFKDFTVANEFDPDAVNRSNTAGTIAMAKTSDPNSATNEFYFNVASNATALDDPNNSGGFTVFGKVASQADQDVLDDLAALRPQNQAEYVFSQANFPTNAVEANFAVVNSVDVVRRTEALEYTATSSDETIAKATIFSNRLVVQQISNGDATITVRATDEVGAFVETTFLVSSHFHPNLTINVLGQPVAIPEGVGLVTGADIHTEAFNPHTHATDGKLHAGERTLVGIDAAGSAPRPVTVKDFFDVWRTTNPGTPLNNPDAFFDRTRIFTNTVVAGQSTLTFTVNGVANQDFENYVMHDGDQIVITFDTI